MFDLPLCNTLLSEEGLSIHASKVRNHIAANQVQPLCRIDHISWPSLQASSCFPDISLPTSFQFLPWDIFSIEKKVTGGVVVEFTVRTRNCDGCNKTAAKDTWQAKVQVRQRAEHPRTLLAM